MDSLPDMNSRTTFVGIPGLPPALFNRPSGCRFRSRCPYAFDRCREQEPPLIPVGNIQVACHLYPTHTALPPLPATVAAGEALATPVAGPSTGEVQA
jgi:oligopeptide/dipeptide ABC transporter ATP-binding protein